MADQYCKQLSNMNKNLYSVLFGFANYDPRIKFFKLKNDVSNMSGRNDNKFFILRQINLRIFSESPITNPESMF